MGDVERAAFKDAASIYHLIKKYPVEVVPRSLSDITTNIDRFFVYREKGEVLGAISWKILPEMGNEKEHIAEIVSLCVDKKSHCKGIGRTLVGTVIKHIRRFHPTKIILLTFSPKFFAKLGFKRISKRRLHNKLYLGCINCTKYLSPLTCPEVAMMLKMT
jgi:amino-acid N-acetyltransferase